MKRVPNKKLTEFIKSTGMTKTSLGNLLGTGGGQLCNYEEDRNEPSITTWLLMKEKAKQSGFDLSDDIYDDGFIFNEDEVGTDHLNGLKANTLQELRELLGLKQNEIAKVLGLHYRMWGRYERMESVATVRIGLRIKRYAIKRGIEFDETIWHKIKNKTSSEAQPSRISFNPHRLLLMQE